MKLPSFLSAALCCLAAGVHCGAPPAARAQTPTPPSYYLAETIKLPADITANGTFSPVGFNGTESGINAQGYVLFNYIADQNNANSRRGPQVYKGNGQLISLSLNAIDPKSGSVSATCISDLAADGSFFVGGVGKIDANDKTSNRPFVWKVNADGSSDMVALSNFVLPPESTNPGEQGTGYAVAVNSAGVVYGYGNSYLVGIALFWQYPNAQANKFGDLYDRPVYADDSAVLVRDNRPGITYNDTKVPNVIPTAGPAATKAGLIVGTFNGPNGRSRAFVYPVANGNGVLTELPNYADYFDTSTQQSTAEHVNAAGDITGISGAYQSAVLWKRQTDGSYQVFPANSLVARDPNNYVDYGFSTFRFLGFAADGTLLGYGTQTKRTYLIKPGTNAQPPVITSASSASGTVGQAFGFQLAASNSPTSFAVSGLPQGLSLDTTTGLISGTPTAAGTATVSVTATNAAGSGSGNLTITIAAAPANGHAPFFLWRGAALQRRLLPGLPGQRHVLWLLQLSVGSALHLSL